MGNIGADVFRQASGFGMRYIAHDPYMDEASAKEIGVELVSMEELFVRPRAHAALARPAHRHRHRHHRLIVCLAMRALAVPCPAAREPDRLAYRGAGAVGFPVGELPAQRRDARPGRRAEAREDEANRLPHQHRA